MKKILFLATIMAALFASCQKKCFSEPTIEVSGDFIASFADTRTELDGTAVVWNEDDCLTIFTKTAHNRKYQVKELSDDGRTATFGYVSFTGNNDTKITTNYALYPYDADATLTAGVVTTTLQPTQTYNGANGSLGYALMVASSSNTNFSFINAGSLLRFKLSKLVPDAFTLKTIKVASANNNIAGTVTINLGSSDAKAFVSSNGVKEITLSDINYDVTTDVKEFYVAMPSVSFEDKELTVTFVFEEGEKVFELPAFDLEQGKIKSISYEINDAEDFTGSAPDSGEIVPIAKPAVNEIWYTTTDGEMAELKSHIYDMYPYSQSYDEENDTWIIRFEDSVAHLYEEGIFNVSNSNVKTITLPNSITYLPHYAFGYLSSLTSITIPNSVTEIGPRAFYNCSSLTSATIPNSVTSIGQYAFDGCNKIEDLIIPDGVSTIYKSSLPPLNNLTIGSNVTSIEHDADLYYIYRTIYCRPTTPPSGLGGVHGLIFEDGIAMTTIYVPHGCTDAYKAAIDPYNRGLTVIEIDF
jgi:hypothetical protein